MKKTFAFLILSAFACMAQAQTETVLQTEEQPEVKTVIVQPESLTLTEAQLMFPIPFIIYKDPMSGALMKYVDNGEKIDRDALLQAEKIMVGFEDSDLEYDVLSFSVAVATNGAAPSDGAKFSEAQKNQIKTGTRKGSTFFISDIKWQNPLTGEIAELDMPMQVWLK